MVATYHDRSLEFPASNHLVEGEPEAVAFTQSYPADPGRQALKRDPLAGQSDPAGERLVLGIQWHPELSGVIEATQQAINRGMRLEELLKQPQYEPVPVEEQVAVIYAGTSGALDEVPPDRIGEFEKGYRDHLRAAIELGGVPSLILTASHGKQALVAQSQKRSAVYDILTNPTNVTVEVA